MTQTEKPGLDDMVMLVDYKNNRSLRSYGVACHYWNAETTSLHCHNFFEFFIVTSGEAIHEINGEHFKLHKCALRFIEPHDRHRIISSERTGCTHINISVTPQKLEKLCEAMGITLSEFIDNTDPSVTLSQRDLEFFIDRAERATLLYFDSDERFKVVISEMIAYAICTLYKITAFSRRDCPDWFAEILDKIHSPEYSTCCARDIYALAGFSPPSVIALFKRFTGKTVVEYLRDVKLNTACEMLEHSDIPILSVSGALGYQSLSHFNRIFRDSLGVTPREYRRSRRKAF